MSTQNFKIQSFTNPTDFEPKLSGSSESGVDGGVTGIYSEEKNITLSPTTKNILILGGNESPCTIVIEEEKTPKFGDEIIIKVLSEIKNITLESPLSNLEFLANTSSFQSSISLPLMSGQTIIFTCGFIQEETPVWIVTSLMSR